MDTLTSIRAFSRTVELGSLTAAAADLGISTAMVSKHLKYLESMVDARLLQRTTRSICLTEEGRLCYEHYRTALSEIDKVKEIFDASKGNPSGTLRVTTPSFIAEHFLQPVIATYVGNHPQMKLDVVLTDDMPDLVDQGLDLALWVAETLPGSVIARQLMRVDQVMVAAPKYLDQAGRPGTPFDLRDHMILALSSGGVDWSLSAQAQKVEITLQRYMLLDSRFACRLAEEGMGVAMLPTCMVEDQIRDGRLETVLRDWHPPERHLFAVYPSRRHLAAKVRAFVDLVAEAFRHNAQERRVSASDKPRSALMQVA